MNARVTFIGEPIMDVLCPLDHWPQLGDKATFSSLARIPGGTIANMAVAARCSTADVVLIGFLKDCPDSGTLLDDLNSCGIDTSLITQITDGVEPVCLVFITEGSNAVIYPDRQSETVTLDEQALERISTSTILCSTPE